MAAERSGVALDDPFAVTQLDISDIQKDHGRLSDEMNSIGLFGGERLIWVKGAANEKPLVDFIDDPDVGGKTAQQAWLIIEAGDLKKTSSLRKAAARSRAAAAIPCYSDDLRGLGALVDEVLSLAGKRISPNARLRLLENLGADRMASRAEVNKLALYCHHVDLIEEHHVTEIIGDASTASIDEAIDALLKGDRSGVINATRKVLASRTAVYQLLNSVLRQFQLLDLLRTEMDQRQMSPSQVVAEHGRQIFFKRKPIITAALNAWTSQKLVREMQRLQSTVLQCQKNPAVSESAALQLLLSLTIQSTVKS
jgi:DNA polymerase-3 subunit delta